MRKTYLRLLIYSLLLTELPVKGNPEISYSSESAPGPVSCQSWAVFDGQRILEQVRQTKESTLETAQKHFNAPVDTLEGTVKHASSEGIELEEYPGRTFRFSAVGLKMADLVADELGRHNDGSRSAGRTLVPPRPGTTFSARAGSRPGPAHHPVNPPGRDPSLLSDRSPADSLSISLTY